jgi:pyruvate kinase
MNRDTRNTGMHRARVVATIGPSSDETATLAAMVEAGMDVARLNYSHGDMQAKATTIERLRAVEANSGRPLGILADLPGPKLRLGAFEGSLDLQREQHVTLLCGQEATATADARHLPVPYASLASELRVGDPVLLADGLVRLEVTHIEGQAVHTVVVDGGRISERKGINVPRTLVSLPAVGPEDERCLRHALDHGVDFVAVSYVRSASDLEPARRIIAEAGLHTWVVAKIEHPAALDHLDAIVEAADVVMVARGDLGVEIPLEEVPAAQERIVDRCLQHGRPVIVATQMLESMVDHPRPTRAEVSDVATAIRQFTSAVMLSGETASGKHPVKAVETMVRIAERAAVAVNHLPSPPALALFKSTRAITGAAAGLAAEVHANLLLVATQHGNAVRLMAAHRPPMPIVAMTDRPRALRRTTLLPGVLGCLVEERSRSRETVAAAVESLFLAGHLSGGETMVTVTGSPFAIRGRTSTVRLIEVDGSGHLRMLE